MVASIPSWIWQTYVYVPGAAPASETVQSLRTAVLGSAMRLVNLGAPMNPESATVVGVASCETPLPPSNSTSSGGPKLQPVGPIGTSTDPSSQKGWNSFPRSPGNVTVCGSFDERDVKTTC